MNVRRFLFSTNWFYHYLRLANLKKPVNLYNVIYSVGYTSAVRGTVATSMMCPVSVCARLSCSNIELKMSNCLSHIRRCGPPLGNKKQFVIQLKN